MTDQCISCGAEDWELLYHADTTSGGGWTYRCRNCKQWVVTYEYCEKGFDEFGRPNDTLSETKTGES